MQFDLETPSGQVAYTHVKNNNLKEWSFAFDIEKGGAEMRSFKADDGTESEVRYIKSIGELFEVSLVLVGANPATATVGWKSKKAKKAAALPIWTEVGILNALQAQFATRRDIR